MFLSLHMVIVMAESTLVWLRPAPIRVLIFPFLFTSFFIYKKEIIVRTYSMGLLEVLQEVMQLSLAKCLAFSKQDGW